MTTRQFTGAVNRSKSLSREPCGRGGKCEERGIQSGRREGGKEVGRDGEMNGRRNSGRVGRDEEMEKREKKGGRKGRLKRVLLSLQPQSYITQRPAWYYHQLLW